MADYTERNHIRTKHRDEWQQGQPLPGTFTTAETPAQGYFVEGSIIPPGRFVAMSPAAMASTSANWQSAILPDKLGTSLFNMDGTDYTATIGDAFMATGNFEIIGVSVDYDCITDCEKLYVKEPCPPLGYVDEAMRWKYFKPARANVRGASSVSLVHNDHVWVYTEKAMKPGDPVFIRIEVVTPYVATAGVPAELFGGVTNVADAGTMPITDTRFANARVDAPAIAGGAVKIFLG
ncbi:MAG: hypothetical protein GKR96_04210 [Gammaproteobacteria bacterium]|nr:hypothetical protein [Gammaproteobacteria bacterium]